MSLPNTLLQAKPPTQLHSELITNSRIESRAGWAGGGEGSCLHLLLPPPPPPRPPRGDANVCVCNERE